MIRLSYSSSHWQLDQARWGNTQAVTLLQFTPFTCKCVRRLGCILTAIVAGPAGPGPVVTRDSETAGPKLRLLASESGMMATVSY